MFLYEAMGIKRFIELTREQFIDEKIKILHQFVQKVPGDEEMEGYHMKSYRFDRC